jgi:hypothetical protein
MARFEATMARFEAAMAPEGSAMPRFEPPMPLFAGSMTLASAVDGAPTAIVGAFRDTGAAPSMIDGLLQDIGATGSRHRCRVLRRQWQTARRRHTLPRLTLDGWQSGAGSMPFPCSGANAECAIADRALRSVARLSAINLQIVFPMSYPLTK